MKFRALESFSGLITMAKNSVKEIDDEYVIKDLMRAGYIEPVAQEAEVVEEPVEEAAQPEAVEESSATETEPVEEKAEPAKKKSK